MKILRSGISCRLKRRRSRASVAFVLLACATGTAFAADVTLNQCANGKIGTARVACTASQWQTGDLNANNSQYAEGFANSFIATMSLPSAGTYTITISYQTTKAGKHAYVV